MASLDPSGRHLFYVSNENATWQIYVQHLNEAGLPEGGPLPLFALAGDALDPHVSPDGRTLLFISYKDDATGDACVLPLAPLLARAELGSGSNATGTRKSLDVPRPEPQCLTNATTADVQALWEADGQHVLVLSRQGLHSDFEVRRLKVGESADARPDAGDVILRQNMVGPTLTRDGRGLLFVPVERRTLEVGVNFARQTSRALAYQAFEGTQSPRTFEFSLPGVSGFPALSPDGQYLYFSQYLNDTNGDGEIDGDDNSVLLRIRWDSHQSTPMAGAQPEQLTSSDWNCQYPVPSTGLLLMTCAHQGSLDLYRLPLDGALPSDWGRDRLEEELEASRNEWHRLLVASRMLQTVTDASERISILQEMIRLHLNLGEYESARFYTTEAQGLDVTGLQGMKVQAAPLLELIGLYREERQLSEGRLSADFIRNQRQRLARLNQVIARNDSAQPLALTTRSALFDILGEKGMAREALSGVELARLTDPFLIQLIADHFSRLLQALDQEPELLELLRTVATHPALPTRIQLRYAERFCRQLTRGRPFAERLAFVMAERRRSNAPGGKETSLDFLLDVQAALLKLRDHSEEEVRVELFNLYKGHPDFDQRKALVLATLRAAAALDSDALLYDFANTWVSGLKRGMSERRYAEELYRDVVLERAYLAFRQDNFSDARGFFYGLTLQSDALEAYMGFIDARLKEGKSDAVALLEKRFPKEPDHPLIQFAEAWLVLRTLTTLPSEAFNAQAQGLEQALSACEKAYPGTAEVLLLKGYLAHERFRRSGSGALALEAGQDYRLALDLARENPRIRAKTLQLLGTLQLEIGSARVARRLFDERATLPVLEPKALLSLQLARARGAWQSGADQEAIGLIQAALQTLHASPGLEPFRALVLNRGAFYAWSIGQLAQADTWLHAWEQLPPAAPIATVGAKEAHSASQPSVSKTIPSHAGSDDRQQQERDQRQQRLSRLTLRAVVSQGLQHHAEAVAALREANQLLADPAPLWDPALEKKPPTDRYFFGREAHTLLNQGLLAQSLAALGQYAEAISVLEQRISALEQHFKTDDLDEDLQELAIAHQQQATWHARLKERDAALQKLEQGWTLIHQWQTRTETPLSDVGLELLQSEAALLLEGPPRAEEAGLRASVRDRVTQTWELLARSSNPRWSKARFLFPVYLSLL